MAHSLHRKFSCPVELALEILGGKWKTVILSRLKESPLSWSELRAQIPSLSDKMLTQRLRDLEELGLLERSARGTRAHYRLTARARSLRPALEGLYDWGSRMAGEVGAVLD